MNYEQAAVLGADDEGYAKQLTASASTPRTCSSSASPSSSSRQPRLNTSIPH